MKFWERAGIVIMSAWGLFAVHQGVNALVRAHNWQPMTISDWGTWAGAVGTIAAVLASFFLFKRQREHELQQTRNDDLQRRCVAVQSLQDVTSRALSAMESLHEIRACMFPAGVVPDIAPRLPELRAILDRFADPTADRVVVIAALAFSHALAETETDIKIPEQVLDVEVTSRMEDRVDELSKMQDRLIAHMVSLDDECRRRGIGADDL